MVDLMWMSSGVRRKERNRVRMELILKTETIIKLRRKKELSVQFVDEKNVTEQRVEMSVNITREVDDHNDHEIRGRKGERITGLRVAKRRMTAIAALLFCCSHSLIG